MHRTGLGTWLLAGDETDPLVDNLHMFDNTPIDQTSQGVRVVGDCDTNYALFVGGTLIFNS